MSRRPIRRITLEEIALSRNRVFVSFRGVAYTVTALNVGLVAVSRWEPYNGAKTYYYWTSGRLYDGRGWNIERLIWFMYHHLKHQNNNKS